MQTFSFSALDFKTQPFFFRPHFRTKRIIFDSINGSLVAKESIGKLFDLLSKFHYHYFIFEYYLFIIIDQIMGAFEKKIIFKLEISVYGTFIAKKPN